MQKPSTHVTRIFCRLSSQKTSERSNPRQFGQYSKPPAFSASRSIEPRTQTALPRHAIIPSERKRGAFRGACAALVCSAAHSRRAWRTKPCHTPHRARIRSALHVERSVSRPRARHRSQATLGGAPGPFPAKGVINPISTAFASHLGRCSTRAFLGRAKNRALTTRAHSQRRSERAAGSAVLRSCAGRLAASDEYHWRDWELGPRGRPKISIHTGSAWSKTITSVTHEFSGFLCEQIGASPFCGHVGTATARDADLGRY